jgi:hypothetical protein
MNEELNLDVCVVVVLAKLRKSRKQSDLYLYISYFKILNFAGQTSENLQYFCKDFPSFSSPFVPIFTENR